MQIVDIIEDKLEELRCDMNELCKAREEIQLVAHQAACAIQEYKDERKAEATDEIVSILDESSIHLLSEECQEEVSEMVEEELDHV